MVTSMARRIVNEVMTTAQDNQMPALVLLQLHLVFTGWGRLRGYRRVLRELNRQCWLMYGDAASGHRYAVMWHRARRGGRLVRGSVS